MEEDYARETARVESENEGGEESGHETSYFMDGGRAKRTKSGQPNDAFSVSQSQTSLSAANGGFGNEHLYMPPWTINVVALTGERSMESINIPQDVQFDAIHIGTKQKFVGAAYANELLKQIAGLAAVVKQRAHDARDLFSKHQQHTVSEFDNLSICDVTKLWHIEVKTSDVNKFAYDEEWILSHRVAEVMALRRELYQFRNKECSTQVEAPPCTAPVCTIELDQSEPDNVNEMQQIAKDQHIQVAEYNSMKTPREDMSEARVDEGTKLHGRTNNHAAVIANIEPYLSAEEQNLRIKRRQQPSVSEHSEDVIYASWKITRSE